MYFLGGISEVTAISKVCRKSKVFRKTRCILKTSWHRASTFGTTIVKVHCTVSYLRTVYLQGYIQVSTHTLMAPVQLNWHGRVECLNWGWGLVRGSLTQELRFHASERYRTSCPKLLDFQKKILQSLIVCPWNPMPQSKTQNRIKLKGERVKLLRLHNCLMSNTCS